ncbi:hypothetical protein SRHO_G00243430 [Serrasalmus rhombeus]
MKDVELTREGNLLKLVCETCNMKDAFREKFPDDLGFMRISNTVKTRIDRIYVNSSLETRVISYKTEYLMEPDHLGVNVKVNLGVVEDRGYWKLNTQCLKQKNVLLELAKEIERIKSLKAESLKALEQPVKREEVLKAINELNLGTASGTGRGEEWTATYTVNGTDIAFKLDTAAQANILSETELAKLDIEPVVNTKDKVKLKSYSGQAKVHLHGTLADSRLWPPSRRPHACVLPAPREPVLSKVSEALGHFKFPRALAEALPEGAVELSEASRRRLRQFSTDYRGKHAVSRSERRPFGALLKAPCKTRHNCAPIPGLGTHGRTSSRGMSRWTLAKRRFRS